VLNGVGGRTVAEAKASISITEMLAWQAYRERYGTLHLGMRLEEGFALLAWVINRALGGHAEITTYMPHADAGEATLEDVMQMLTGR